MFFIIWIKFLSNNLIWFLSFTLQKYAKYTGIKYQFIQAIALNILKLDPNHFYLIKKSRMSLKICLIT